jgi:hypothetical protein
MLEGWINEAQLKVSLVKHGARIMGNKRSGKNEFNQSGRRRPRRSNSTMNTYISVRTPFLLAGRCASSMVSSVSLLLNRLSM